ncbi:hypothetical protein ACVMH6_000384 [Rhizobium leguminosarum]
MTLRGKTGWREVEIGRGSSDATCPVVTIEASMRFAKIAKGPLFRRVSWPRQGYRARSSNDKEVARFVKWAAPAAGICGIWLRFRRMQEFPSLEAPSLSKHSYPINVPWFSKADARNHACQANIWLDGLVDAAGMDVLPVEHVAQGAVSALAGKRAVRQRFILEWQEAEYAPADRRPPTPRPEICQI